jgi:hypothetical protein
MSHDPNRPEARKGVFHRLGDTLAYGSFCEQFATLLLFGIPVDLVAHHFLVREISGPFDLLFTIALGVLNFFSLQ